MTLPLAPLGGTPIVDGKGLPTDFFRGQWQQINGRATDSTTARSATYLTLSANAELPTERVLTAGTGVAFTDGGAGSTLTVRIADTAVTPGTYGTATQVSRVTFDQQGRATGASAVTISIPATAISDSTTVGRAVMTAADAAAARTALALGTIATQSYSTNSWTPTIRSSGTQPTVSYTTQSGVYFQLGAMIFARFEITFTCSAEGTGVLEVGGLAVAAASGSFAGGVYIGYQSGFDSSIDAGYQSGLQTYVRLTSRSGADLTETPVSALSTVNTMTLFGWIVYPF